MVASLVRRSLCLVGALALLGASRATAALALQAERTSATDLEITGLVQGGGGASRFVRWSDLRGLPTQKLTVKGGDLGKTEKEITVVFLADLWKELPVAAGADTLLATCTDDYASVYTQDYIARYRPFLVLEINGVGPDSWPPPGMKYNPGPYVILVSSAVVPDAEEYLDVGHKRPWGVNRIEVANYAERMKPAYSGKWAKLSAPAMAGREIWINSCSSCHVGPGGLWGGNKSQRPFEVIQTHAAYNAAYFRSYVRNPQAINPIAKMEAHGHYTDKQLDELIAFITAKR